jgi:MFS family permease
MVSALGVGQILSWGSSYYLLAVLAPVIAADTGWRLPWIVGGLALGLLTAGLVSPRIGRAIERHGGRPVLVAASCLFAVGLTALALAANLATYLAAWLVLGLAMGAGLYDAAFATLGRALGHRARQAIGALTLFGGFASTVCWPLSAYLVGTLGWRGTCLAYAGLQLIVVLPLYRLGVPTLPEARPMAAAATHDSPRPVASPPVGPFLLLAATITLGSAVSALLSVHLLALLQGLGVGLAAAVALGAVVGPSQVAARAIELAVARYHHPVWTMLASTVLVAGGVALLGSGVTLIPLALAGYGAGIGIASIARGTLPLALFGADGYATVMGRLALPSPLAPAGAPILGAYLMGRLGPRATLAGLLATAMLDIALALALLAWTRRRLT